MPLCVVVRTPFFPAINKYLSGYQGLRINIAGTKKWADPKQISPTSLGYYYYSFKASDAPFASVDFLQVETQQPGGQIGLPVFPVSVVSVFNTS